MTASRQDPGPETPVVRPGGTTTPPGGTAATAPGGTAATGGTPVTPGTSQASSFGSSAGSGPGASTADRAKADADRAAAETRAAAGEVSGGARSAAEQVKERAEGLVENAKERARSVVTDQKNGAAERLTGFADALRHASSDLDEQGQSFVAGFVRQAASGLDHASDAVRRNDVDDLLGGVEDFARRQPAVFIGGAVLAGFGLARFMKSSAERRRGYGTAGPGSTYPEGGF